MDYNDLLRQRRLEDIYHQRASMGGCENFYAPRYTGLGEGEGVLVGGARRKKPMSAYNKFVKAFLSKPANKKKYRSQTALFRAAAAAWCKSGKAKKNTTCKKRRGSKTAPKKRRTRRGRPRGSGYEDDEDDDFLGEGILLGGAARRRVIPSKAQLENLGMDKDDFAALASLKKQRLVPKFSRPQLKRIGNRYATRSSKGYCTSLDPYGKYLLDAEYDCDEYNAPQKKKLVNL